MHEALFDVTVVISMDIDWAPDPVIADTLEILDRFAASATLFATHPTPILRGLDPARFDIGIHPNFNPLLEGVSGTADAILDSLLDSFPDARGVRSHSMLQSSVLLNKFAARGLLYESNHFLPYMQIEPFRLWTGITRIPYNWEDDVHYAYGRDFTEVGVDIHNWPLCVFDFHPVHVYLNTECAARYESARPHYQDANALRRLRNETGVWGARDALLQLLAVVRDGGLESMTLEKVASNFARHSAAHLVHREGDFA